MTFSQCARKDDKRTASVVFWQSEESAKAYTKKGISELTIYVENQKMGTLNVGSFWGSTPECDVAGAVTYHQRVPKNDEQKKVNFQVKSQIMKVVFEGVAYLEPNSCNNVEIH